MAVAKALLTLMSLQEWQNLMVHEYVSLKESVKCKTCSIDMKFWGFKYDKKLYCSVCQKNLRKKTDPVRFIDDTMLSQVISLISKVSPNSVSNNTHILPEEPVCFKVLPTTADYCWIKEKFDKEIQLFDEDELFTEEFKRKYCVTNRRDIFDASLSVYIQFVVSINDARKKKKSELYKVLKQLRSEESRNPLQETGCYNDVLILLGNASGMTPWHLDWMEAKNVAFSCAQAASKKKVRIYISCLLFAIRYTSYI
jgi:hypothetical protein